MNLLAINVHEEVELHSFRTNSHWKNETPSNAPSLWFASYGL